jgi:hypothetical protein
MSWLSLFLSIKLVVIFLSQRPNFQLSASELKLEIFIPIKEIKILIFQFRVISFLSKIQLVTLNSDILFMANCFLFYFGAFPIMKCLSISNMDN